MTVILFFNLYSQITNGAYKCNSSEATQNKCNDLIKLNAAAALGQCLPNEVPKNIPSLLARNNISLFTGSIPKKAGSASDTIAFTDLNDPRVISVARVLSALENIGDKSFDYLRNGAQIKIIFGTNKASNSRRFEDEIQLDGGIQNMTGMLGQSESNGQDNIGLITHELGHYIGGTTCGSKFEGGDSTGNSIGNSTYDAYKRYTGEDRCGITSYARDDYRKNNNVTEEFAEVVAAYITMPQMFQESESEGCRKAFRFMRQLFGESNQLNLNMPSSAMCAARRTSYNPNDPHHAAQEAVRTLPTLPRPTNAPILSFPETQTQTNKIPKALPTTQDVPGAQ